MQQSLIRAYVPIVYGVGANGSDQTEVMRFQRTGSDYGIFQVDFTDFTDITPGAGDFYIIGRAHDGMDFVTVYHVSNPGANMAASNIIPDVFMMHQMKILTINISVTGSPVVMASWVQGS